MKGALEFDLDANKHAVYALTICVPDKIYDNIEGDPILEQPVIIQETCFQIQSVYLNGKLATFHYGKYRVM